MIVAVAAPVVAAPAAVMTLTALLGWCVAFGLLYVYRRTLSQILTGIADITDRIEVSVRFATVRPLGPLSAAIRRADNAIIEALETWIRGAEIMLGYFWNSVADSIDYLGREIADLAETTSGAVTTVVRQVIPDAIRDYAHDTRRRVNVVSGRVSEITAVALPGIRTDVGALGGRVRAWERDLTRLGSRVRHSERLLAGSAFAALTMIALRKMGLAWLRCGNVRKLGKRLCGLDPRIIDAAIIGGLTIAGTLSLERMTRDLLAQMDTFEAALRRGYKEI